ncbi:MAG: hypothetical protein QOG53_3134 [Frankiales bacterium]|nr:hypothetical protein [Frankiales bacterium]
MRSLVDARRRSAAAPRRQLALDDGLTDLIPLFRRLVEADLRLAQAVWLHNAGSDEQRRLEGRREAAVIDLAANLIAQGWSPP